MRGLCCVLLLVSACVLSANGQLSPVVQGLVKNMQSMWDNTVDPCSDFFQYACGTYMKNNPIPANVTAPEIILPTINGIGYGNDALLAKIVNDPWPIVNDIYTSCMETNLEADFVSFYTSQVKQIDSVDVTQIDNLWKIVASLVGRTINAFFTVQVDVDNYQVSTISIAPAGNSMSASSYNNPTMYKQLIAEIEAVFEIFESSDDAMQDAVAAASIEEFIAAAVNGSVSNITVAQLTESTTLDFQFLFDFIGVQANQNTYILVTNVDYFAKLSQIATGYPARSIQRFMEWQQYQIMSMFNLSQCIENPAPQNFICDVIMENSPYNPPWDQASVCRNFVHMVVSDLVGLIFNYEIVTPDVASGIRNMTTGIQQAFNKSLPSLGWLDPAGINAVQFKLDHVIQIIGHSNRMEKYENLTTSPNAFHENFYDVLFVDQKWFYLIQSSPFNRSDYTFDPMVVNAFYSPNTNTINFPAGILESPMFSGSWPKLFQYARLGYVVGHENTHGFDNNGSEWDAYGLPGDLFDEQTRESFNNNSQCIADFYSQFVVYGTTHLDGQKTLGENIADIGGVKNSFRAYQAFVATNGPEFNDNELIPGLTVSQTYFLFMGQTWCSSENLAYAMSQQQNDVHSPARFRVNGPLSQFDQFSAAFNCPASAPMNPPSRCDLW